MTANTIAIVSAVIAAISALAAIVSQYKKDRIDAANLALDLVEKLEKRVMVLEAENQAKDARIDELEKITKEQDEKITDQDKKITCLEEENQELRDRLEIYENRKANAGRSK